jgi:hypothetical protein
MLIYRALSAVAAAACGAALVLAVPGFSPQVEAGTTAPAIAAESAPVVDTCSQQAWPYYGANCLRDQAQPRAVRVVSTDRLSK